MTKILFVGEGTVSDAVRCQLPGFHLNKLGFEVDFTALEYREGTLVPLMGYDAIVFSRPHHDSLITAYRRLGIPVIVDMDDDFHAIPEKHPGYKFVGKGDPYYLMKLDNCIYAASLITTATSILRDRLLPINKNIKVIPNGWSADNFHWLVKRSLYKDRFIIGWGGTITHREDFKMCVHPLMRFIKEYPQAMVCIAGDPEIYNMLKRIPEKQKLFVPMVSYDVYPAMLSLWDVMLAPLLDNEFNQAKSDIKLVDAGAKMIPYICSKMPVYSNWPGGGFEVGHESDEWYGALEYLFTHPDEAKTIARNGHDAARGREMTKMSKVWKEAIEGVLK
jgi:hypothetical protein